MRNNGWIKLLTPVAFISAIISLSAFDRGLDDPISFSDDLFLPNDTTEPDSTLPYPFKDKEGGLYLNNPSNFTEEVEFDPVTGQYKVTQKIGNLVVKPPMLMTPEEYQQYIADKQVDTYWKEKTQSTEAAKAEGRDAESSLIPQIRINSEAFERIFGTNVIDIRPQGYAELSFGGRFQKIDNPIIPENNRSTFNFDFDQRIQMNVTGSIGNKVSVGMNYDTEATFSFENQTKLEWEGEEDDIVKKLELGNVSLPLNSTLISGAQSLFGVKGQFQFGKLTLTGVFSEQRSQTSSINVQGGSTTTEFEIWGDQYEANKHFFLSHYFRDNYERFLSNPPLIISPVQITKVEVWVTNTRQETENTRNIVAFQDLGEANNAGAYRNTAAQRPGPDIFGRFFPFRGFPDNRNNALDPDVLEQTYPQVRDVSQVNSALNSAGFEEAIEYIELSNARKLRPTEFTFHRQLGYVSLSSALNQDEVVAVAFQFTAGGRTFQVGEFSTDGVAPPQTLVLKMLKSTILNVQIPMWDLMMKNIYSLNAFQVNQEDFRLEVLYRDDASGVPVPYLPDGNLKDQLLLRVMDLDRVNANNDPQPDGFFDFVFDQSTGSPITINPQNGRIIFPVLEPFGSHLAGELNTDELRDNYVFQQLYDSTRFVAQNETRLNKFLLKGQYKSASGSEISLNAFNIPRGSVTVSAGGGQLVENVDYTVDYNLGRVKIINEGILQSGLPIKVDFENNSLFNFQTKTFMGLNAEYKFNENLNVGGTILNLTERPLTQKVNIGSEPISNTIFGFNGTYTKDAPYLTRYVDAIPFIETKAPSNLTVQAEYAQLVPGSPRGIKINGEETTYLDDFESSQTSIDLRGPRAWSLASTPAGQPDLFPEASSAGLEYGYNRARVAWYNIDPLFYQSTAQTPDNIKNDPDLQSEHYTRQVWSREVFPNLQLDLSQVQTIPTLDVAFYPKEKGPYNFDVEGEPGISAGIEGASGELLEPDTRWGGIMRAIANTNFEQQNIEFIQFWIMDPFLEDPNAQGGDLYFNLGNVSEDILKDGKQAIENGIPVDGNTALLDSTIWGLVPRTRPPVIAFENDPDVRNAQDVGYDLLDDAQERVFSYQGAATYLDRIANTFGQTSLAWATANADPASDNFVYFRGAALDQANADIQQRYKNFNNQQGNSNTTQINGFTASSGINPHIEDINGDQTLSKTEAYYQYKISMTPAALRQVGRNYITDIRDSVLTETLPNTQRIRTRWIQFKIPIFEPDAKVGPISDFRSIRFMRMFLKEFEDPVVLRFARLELIRGEWRRYRFNLDVLGGGLVEDDPNETLFEVNAVNIEQNADRIPIPYALPPGIDRQILFGTASAQQQNEQALSMRVCGLKDGGARAVFRNINFDMRLYKRLKMFTHAESAETSDINLEDGDLTVFIRMGADYAQNFYEYELPLKVTRWNTTVPEEIWPVENEIDLDLNVLKQVKLERDRVYRGSGTPNTEVYTVPKGAANVSVIGSPNLGNVRTIMIGIRNPRKRFANDNTDDGLEKCAEIWVNELRLTEFDQRGGWAANARVAAQLADFANVQVSGRTSSVGFGSIDQSVSERNQEETFAYDLQSSFQLGMFFPKDYGLKIPMFISNSEEWSNPQFSPLNPDVEFQDALNNLETQEEKDDLRRKSQDYTKRRSLNFTNVRKERTGTKAQKKPMPYDVENFSASYAFNETFRRNINTKNDTRRTYTGTLNYSYAPKPKPVEPFKKVKFLRSKHLALIRDFNFYYVPKNITVIGILDRSTHQLQMRNLQSEFDFPLPVTFNNNFTFNRQYSVLFDLTKSLRFDFKARMNTRIDELIDNDTLQFSDQEKRDEIVSNLRDFGRPTNYHQTININWQVPINKLPFMSFANVTATYTGDYDWRANSLTAQNLPVDDSLNFGNTIQNSAQIQLNSTFNMLALYNQVPYLKKINQGSRSRPRSRNRRNVGRPSEEAQADKENEDDEDKPSVFANILKGTAKTLMLVKNASANYNKTQGTLLPGFLPQANILGMDQGQLNAPGFGFTFGDQADIRTLAVDNGWLTESSALNNQYTRTLSETMSFRVTAEPIKSFRIILTANKTVAENSSEFFRYDDLTNQFESQNQFATENYTISYFTLRTAFETTEGPSYNSEAYTNFLNNRLIISRQLADAYALNPEFGTSYSPELIGNPDSANYGYRYFSQTSQEVLIPAFLAAYTGSDVNGFGTGYRRNVPLPNWQVTYDGLSRVPWVKKFLNSLVLNHSYRSTYTINNISTNLLRQQQTQEFPDRVPLNNNGDLLPEKQIGAIVLAEQFAPFLGINLKLKNSTTLKIEYKKSRNLTLSMANSQITETKSTEWTIGTGYIIKNLRLKFVSIGARKTNPVSNLELKVDFSIRDNVTVIRRIVEQINQATAGQRITTLKFTADYRLSKRVNSKLFYDMNLSRFRTTNAFPISTHQFGISFRLNLGQ